MQLEPLIPPVWAPEGHLQTILGHLLPSPKLRSKGRRIEFALPGGDRLVGFVEEGTSNTVVYVFHGLAGSTDSRYMHRTSMLAQKLGHTVILFNHRGCGEGAGLAREPYHSGRGDDLSAMIEEGRRLFPRKRHVAVGFSMSGNALLLLLSGKRGTVLPDAAVAVNAPINLEKCSRLLGEGLNKVYDIKFYRQCLRDVRANPTDELLRSRLPALAPLYRFDDLYTAPAAGFRDRLDYYTSCSTVNWLGDIQIPTVILTSGDDPFVPAEDYRTAKPSSKVRMHIEPVGGHMGYLTRKKTPLGDFRWQDYAVNEALKNLD